MAKKKIFGDWGKQMEANKSKIQNDVVIQKLFESKLFMDVPYDEIEDLVNTNTGYQTSYQRGEILIREDETWNSIDVILEGKVRVKRLFEDGTEATVQQLWEKDVIGMEFLQKADEKSRFYYVAEEETVLFSIHKWHFSDHRQLGAKVSFKMLKNLIGILSHENIRQHRMLDILSAKSLRERILVYLNYEQKKRKQMAFDIPYSREALAAFLRVNRSALSRELGKMEQDGILNTKGRHFELLQTRPK